MDKADKKKLMKQYKMVQAKKFEDSLPMERKLFYELFDYLNDKSETVECNHDFSLTNEFLKDKNVDIEKVLEFLEGNDAYCDCEVIFNIEEKFGE